MKTPLFVHILMICCLTACGQDKETFDIAGITTPGKEWTRQESANRLVYTKTDKKDGSWCQLAIYKSIPSKGSLQDDFSAEWQQLVAEPNHINDAPKTENPRDIEGWQMQVGAAKFRFNNKDALALLTTYSGYNTCLSILIQSNKKELLDQAMRYLDGITLQKSATTHFEDRWTSSIQNDWVQATKGNIQVLIHYPSNITTKYYSDRLEEDRIVWNLYITSRYTNIQQFEQLKNNLSYEPVHFMGGNMTDAGGQQHFVALFRKGSAKNGWIEIICPDRASFSSAFGIDKYDVYFTGWDPLAKLNNLNRFAVAPSDLNGKWTTNFNGMTQYVNVYTGASAGTKTYQSEQKYNFTGGTKYNWEINVVKGYVGSYDHQNAKSFGTYSMPDNWHIHLSDQEGKPKDFEVMFTAIKDGRVLWIDGQAFAKKE